MPTARAKDRFIPLPADYNAALIPEEDDEPLSGDEPRSPRALPKHGKITVCCVADAFNREQLEELVQQSLPGATYRMYPEVVYIQTPYSGHGEKHADVFFFDVSPCSTAFEGNAQCLHGSHTATCAEQLMRHCSSTTYTSWEICAPNGHKLHVACAIP